MENDYWNKCTIVKVLSNSCCKGLEEWLLLDNEDKSLRFEVFASCCRKFQQKKFMNFDFERFKPGKEIEIKIGGLFECIWNTDDKYWTEGLLILKNKSGDKYLVLGKVIKAPSKNVDGRMEGILKCANLYVYFTDHNCISKIGNRVIAHITGVDDLK